MTAKSSRDGLRPRAHRLLSRLAAAFVVGALWAGTAVAVDQAPVFAADADTPTAEDPTVELGLSTGAAGRVAPNGPLVSSIAVINHTEDTLSAGTVTVQLGATPLTTEQALDAWMTTGSYSGALALVATESSPQTAPGARTELTSVAEATALSDRAPGVYPLLARLEGASTNDTERTEWSLSASTVLVVTAEAGAQVRMLVPITATPRDGSLLTVDELNTLTAADGALTGQLDAVTGTSAILAVDPAIAASIRMLGSRAPQSAVTWLQNLQALPNETFALQFGDADPAAQAQSGLKTLLDAPSLTPLLRAEDFPQATPTPAPTAPATGAPSPDPGTTAELPDDAALTTLSSARTDVAWPSADVTLADLAAFDGYLGGKATTVLPSTSVGGAMSGPVDVGGHSVLVTDAEASARLSAAAELTESTAIERELAVTAAHLALQAPAGRSVLVGLDRSESRSALALRTLLTGFASPAPAPAVLGSAPVRTASLTTTADLERAAALSRMLQGEQRLQAFSSILDEPAVLMAPERIRVLRTIAVGVQGEDFGTAVTTRAQQVQTTLNSVSIQRPKPVQLVTSAAPLPVWVRNDLPWPVHVTLHGRPSDPRLDIQPRTEVEAAPAGITRVNVPIEARVASGEVRVQFRLTSPAGVEIGPAEVADVTLRADWEGIGLGILGGAIALLLIFGLIRTVRRKRGAASASAEAGQDTGVKEESP